MLEVQSDELSKGEFAAKAHRAGTSEFGCLGKFEEKTRNY